MSTHALATSSTGVAPGAAEELACLSVVHHPDPAWIGRRLTLQEGEDVMLGRGSDLLGPDVLNDDRLSRRHVLLSREGRGVAIEDQASRNGTTINGRRAGVSQLRQGDVLGIGRLLLLFHWVPEGHRPLKHPRVIGEGPALAGALEQVKRRAQGRAPVLIRGEVGVGRRHLAYELHRTARKGTPYGVLDCSSGKEPPWDRIRTRVGEGTLVLSDFDRSPMSFQRSVMASAEDPATPFRLVLTMTAAPHVSAQEGRLAPELSDAFAGGGLRLPPLRHRPEDLLPLVRHFARELAGAPRHVSRRLTLMLLLLRWPGNAAEVKKVVQRLVQEQRQHLTLRAPTWLAEQVSPTD